MTVEERVRRIEQWIASRDTAEMMRLQADIRVSLHTPFPDSPKDERIAALEAERDEARAEAELLREKYDGLASRHAFLEATNAEIRKREQRVIAALNFHGPSDTLGPDYDEAIQRIVAERDEAREDAAHDRANEIQMRAERDAARATFHSQVDKHAAVCGELAQCQHALTQVERERDSLRAQLADAHRVLAQGETIDAATERDTREKMERLERGVREAARLLRSDNRSYLEERIALRASWLQEFGS